jgi:hypothetical protein
MAPECDSLQAKNYDSFTNSILEKLKTFQRRPQNINEALIQAREAEKHCTERIFLDTSFGAWFGYLLTCRAATANYHFSGKADLKQMMQRFNEESIDIRKQVAIEVNRRIPEEVMKKMADTSSTIETRKGKGSKRRMLPSIQNLMASYVLTIFQIEQIVPTMSLRTHPHA